MRTTSYGFLILLILSGCSGQTALERSITRGMKNANGTVIFIGIDMEKEVSYNPDMAGERTTPCSTFKIWNTLFGIENGILFSENDQFYKWDGEVRFIPEWNKDLTLGEAFAVSCVPAYQQLAKKTGKNNMKKWIDRIDYGDRDISSGFDQFWLPKKGKKSIKISPKEQALLIKRLVNDELAFSDNSKLILKNIMLDRETKNGAMYGKTGSGQNIDDIAGNNIGWYVGYTVSGSESYSFACLLKGKNVSGKNAKAVIEKILTLNKLL